ncbi:linear amide C-N hydrolase [Salmonella enterica subsp. enterica]|nr:linear amide C-N hydrolase [Salmonella enterica subsp. enterica serovar Abony]EDW2368369.1 linear amide C-N hydrolase [Salmonella enterica subsp. enterica serovar Abony]
MLFIAPALFSYALAAQACTTLAIQDKQGDIFHGRTLEYMQDLPSWLTYYPAGTQFDKKTPDGRQGVSYQAKYPILAITSNITDGDSRDILEGMNSAGLSFSENMIMNAQLPPLPASEYKQAIPVTSLGEWALARFATVGEVKQAIKEGKFWSPELHRFGDLKSPFHYAFYDKKGGSIVVEVEYGKFHVYDNPTRVMTNGPAFPWHLTNLNNYTQLKCVEEVTINEEYYEVPQATADIINTAKQNGGRIFAVGTTVTRCLESAYSREHNCLKASSGWTALYIHPGYQLKVVDCLLTNLHQPKTTHMVLTGQFAGVDLLMKAYASEDIQSCQFDMFGDCMLIIQDEGQG